MKNKICFLVCPIGEKGSSSFKRSETLQKHLLEPVCIEKGYEIIRSDKIYDTDKIDSTIINYLENADLVIADISERNVNVYYEAGYRTAIGKPLIYIAVSGTEFPFDTRNLRTIPYVLNDFNEAQDFKEKLGLTIDAVESNLELIKYDKEVQGITKEDIDAIFDEKPDNYVFDAGEF